MNGTRAEGRESGAKPEAVAPSTNERERMRYEDETSTVALRAMVDKSDVLVYPPPGKMEHGRRIRARL